MFKVSLTKKQLNAGAAHNTSTPDEYYRFAGSYIDLNGNCIHDAFLMMFVSAASIILHNTF